LPNALAFGRLNRADSWSVLAWSYCSRRVTGRRRRANGEGSIFGTVSLRGMVPRIAACRCGAINPAISGALAREQIRVPMEVRCGVRTSRHHPPVLVRRERQGDVDAVRKVVAAAFAKNSGQEPIEVDLLARLRDDPGWLPAYSLVATDEDGAVNGHVVATRGEVDGHPALGLGPIGVHPRAQGRGVGSALMHTVLGAAEGRDEGLVALLGEPTFYERFGFRPASDVGIVAPDPAWGMFFQVRLFVTAAPHGNFRYAAPFAEL
jgi:putative acetyltransferase